MAIVWEVQTTTILFNEPGIVAQPGEEGFENITMEYSSLWLDYQHHPVSGYPMFFRHID